ncbi:MAG: ATP-binding cassette domain-containing protein [Planctomycetes bacterium]|nr:ATP-binding cassette domain-containing protein [Planctomycetota bacterium]
MILATENLRWSYGAAFTLDVPRLALATGETLAIVGPNGAGKSTLLRLLAGLLAPFEGTVALDGVPLDARNPVPHRRRIGFVFARPARFRGTALENAAAGLIARGRPRAGSLATAAALLERLGISRLASARASTLSDGEFQRVALARALATAPDFLFLDEPFARFDPPARAEWAAEIARLAGEGRHGVLLVTQEPAEASRLAGRIAVLDRGRIVQEGSSEELRARPATPVVAQFFGPVLGAR